MRITIKTDSSDEAREVARSIRKGEILFGQIVTSVETEVGPSGFEFRAVLVTPETLLTL